MDASTTPSETHELSAAEAGTRERNLPHLLIVAHDHGVPAALEEWRRMLAEKRKSEDSADSPKAT